MDVATNSNRLEVTEEMIREGVGAYIRYDDRFYSLEEIVELIFREMMGASTRERLGASATAAMNG
jgi:hypothetical protein